MAVTTSSCRFFGKPKPAAPPPVPAPKIEPKPKPSEPPPTLPQAPKLPPQTTTNPPEVVSTTPELEPPAPKPAPPRKSRRGRPAPQPAPVEQEKPTQAQAPPVLTPRLGEILTAEQTREYNRNLDASLDRVRQALNVVQNKPLSTELKDVVTRILTFKQQAEQARTQDLVTAVQLAQRADLLSKDLLERLR